MRILLDEQLPRRLARQLSQHQVRTVQQQGWAGLRNGELLRRAAAGGFEIFLTGDTPIPAKLGWLGYRFLYDSSDVMFPDLTIVAGDGIVFYDKPTFFLFHLW